MEGKLWSNPITEADNNNESAGKSHLDRDEEITLWQLGSERNSNWCKALTVRVLSRPLRRLGRRDRAARCRDLRWEKKADRARHTCSTMRKDREALSFLTEDFQSTLWRCTWGQQTLRRWSQSWDTVIGGKEAEYTLSLLLCGLETCKTTLQHHWLLYQLNMRRSYSSAARKSLTTVQTCSFPLVRLC